MEILEQNYHHIKKSDEYMLLKKYILTDGKLMTYNELTQREINILLFDIRKERLDNYFKWLFVRNRNQTKITFLKEASKILKDDIVDAQLGVSIWEYISPDEIIKCAKKHGLNTEDSDIWQEYNIADMIMGYDENNFRKRYNKFFEKCVDLSGKHSKMVDVYFEMVLKMIPNIRNPKLLKLLSSLKLTNENYEKFKQGKLQRGGGSPKYNPNLPIQNNPTSPDYNPAPRSPTRELTILTAADILGPSPGDEQRQQERDRQERDRQERNRQERDRQERQQHQQPQSSYLTPSPNREFNEYMNSLFKLTMTDLRYLMEIHGYPIYIEHITFMKKLIMDSGSDYWATYERDMLQVNVIEKEKEMWGKMVKELKESRICKRSEYLYSSLMFNEINRPIYNKMTEKYIEMCNLLKIKKEEIFITNLKNYFESDIKGSIYKDFYNAFDINSRLNFKVGIDKVLELESQQMLMALVGTDKHGKYVDMRPKRLQHGNFFFNINLLVLLKTDDDGNETSKYITTKDFINFFRYLYELKDIYINEWSKVNDGEKKKFKFPVRRRRRQHGGGSNDSKYPFFTKEKMNKYFTNIIQDQILRIQIPFIHTINDIIERNVEDDDETREIVKMIRSKNFIYKLHAKNNVQLKVKDFLNEMIVELKKERDSVFKKFLLNQILNFIIEKDIPVILNNEFENYKYMELFNHDALEVGNEKLNHLPMYIQVLKQYDLTESQKEKVKKIMKLNRDIVGNILEKGIEKKYKKLTALGSLSNEEDKVLRSNIKEFNNDINNYTSDLNNSLSDLRKKRKRVSPTPKHIPTEVNNLIGEFVGSKKYETRKELKKFNDNLDKKINKKQDALSQEGKHSFLKFMINIERLRLRRIREEVWLEKHKIKPKKSQKVKKVKPINFNKLLKDVRKSGKMDRSIARDNQIKKSIKMNKDLSNLFQAPPDRISEDLKMTLSYEDYQMYKSNAKRMEIQYYDLMRKQGLNILETFGKTYKIFNMKKHFELKLMFEKFLVHQKKYLKIIHMDIRKFRLSHSGLGDSLVSTVSRINYEYMIIVCLILSVLKGVDLNKIDKIDFLDTDEVLNLKGYDKNRNRFVKIVKVEKSGLVKVKNNNEEYQVNRDDLVMGNYLRVKIIGRHQYKGIVGKLINVINLSNEEMNKLYEEEKKIKNNLFKLKQMEKENTLVYKNYLINLSVIKSKLKKNNQAMVLINEGSVHKKVIRINTNNIKIIESKKFNLTKPIYINLRLDDENWNKSILAYVYKTYNNLMTNTRNSFGLAYFKRFYNMAIKQINNYLKSVNEDYIKREKLQRKVNENIKLLKSGKRKKIGRSDLLKQEINITRSRMRKFKVRYEECSVFDKKRLSFLLQFNNDFEVKKEKSGIYTLYLKNNKSDFIKIENELGKIVKNKEKNQDVKEKVDLVRLTAKMSIIMDKFRKDLDIFINPTLANLKDESREKEIVNDLISKEENSERELTVEEIMAELDAIDF